LPISERRKYVRPDTFRVYIPESEQYDSGIDEEQNEENKKLGETYKTKRIAKVVNKHRNSTGKVFYDVLFRNEQTVEEVHTYIIIISSVDQLNV
jgi:hypothetical protein